MQKKISKREKIFVVFKAHQMDDHKTLFQKMFRWVLNNLKKDFSHVCLYKIARISGNIIEFNCCSDGFSVDELTKQEFMDFVTKPGITMISVPVQDQEIQAKGFITCVSTAKHYLGINNPFIITPYQLYKYLEKKYGK